MPALRYESLFFIKRLKKICPKLPKKDGNSEMKSMEDNKRTLSKNDTVGDKNNVHTIHVWHSVCT
jgi:hypothetical protein